MAALWCQVGLLHTGVDRRGVCTNVAFCCRVKSKSVESRQQTEPVTAVQPCPEPVSDTTQSVSLRLANDMLSLRMKLSIVAIEKYYKNAVCVIYYSANSFLQFIQCRPTVFLNELFTFTSKFWCLYNVEYSCYINHIKMWGIHSLLHLSNNIKMQLTL